MSWFILALLSPLFWGIENFLYKVSARLHHDQNRIGAIFTGTALVCITVLMLLSRQAWTDIPFFILISILNATTFLLEILTRARALKKVDVNYFFPVTKVGSLVLLVIFAILIQHKSLTALQAGGLGIACLAIYLLSLPPSATGEKKRSRTGEMYTFFYLLSMTANLITAALAMERLGIWQFMFGIYTLTMLLTLLTPRIFPALVPASSDRVSTTSMYRTGMAIGLFNFLGAWLYLEAIRLGNIAIVGGLNNFSLLVTVACTIFLPSYREPFGPRRVLGVALAFLSIFLLR